MIKEFVYGRVAVFIDAANIFYSQRTLGWRIDYTKLKEYFEKETDLVAMYLYTGKVGSDEKQEKFLSKITQLGYIVRAKEVKRIKVGSGAFEWKGNLDVELALDAYKSCNSFDTCVLFSGDSDFAYLLDLMKQEGKKVIVVSMRGHIARELIVRAKYIPLPRLRSSIEKIKGPDKPALEV